MANVDENYVIEQFTLSDNDYETLAELITNAFLHDEAAKKEGGSIVFDIETFKRMFGSPFMPKDLFVRTIFKPTNKIVGFIGCIPRPVKIGDRIIKFVVPSFAAVHFEHQRKGISIKMGLELRRFLIEKGYEAGFALFEPEQKGKDLGHSVIRNSEDIFPMQRIMTIRKFLIRVFDVNKVATVVKFKWYEKAGIRLFEKIQKVNNPSIRKFKPNDVERLYELLDDHIKNNQMSIMRDRDDFIWYLQQPGVNCVVHENSNGLVDGFLVAWKFNFAGYGNIIPFGWLDLVHTYRLSVEDAVDLCKYLALTSKQLGWHGLQMPYIPYFDPKPFKKSKFIFFPKILTVDVFRREDIPFPEKIDSFYFDWR